MDKNNFLLYKDFKSTIDLLSDEQAGKLIKAVFSYVNGRVEPVFDDGMILIAFNILKTQLERDLQKYKTIAKRNQINGAKGGRPKNNPDEENKPKKPSGLNENPTKTQKPKKADSVRDSVSDSDSDKKDKNLYSPDKTINDDLNIAIKYIVDYLNNKLGSKYSHKTKTTRDLIKARFNEGRTIEDFIYVIDNRYDKWHNDKKMVEFLRPATLFSNKFEGYLNVQEDTNKKFKYFMDEEYKKTGELL